MGCAKVTCCKKKKNCAGMLLLLLNSLLHDDRDVNIPQTSESQPLPTRSPRANPQCDVQRYDSRNLFAQFASSNSTNPSHRIVRGSYSTAAAAGQAGRQSRGQLHRSMQWPYRGFTPNLKCMHLTRYFTRDHVPCPTRIHPCRCRVTHNAVNESFFVRARVPVTMPAHKSVVIIRLSPRATR